jgi:hypothetical protein
LIGLRAGALAPQFGPFKGTPLRELVLREPAYVRHLARRARRPDVRAAAHAVLRAIGPIADEWPPP